MMLNPTRSMKIVRKMTPRESDLGFVVSGAGFKGVFIVRPFGSCKRKAGGFSFWGERL